MLFRQHLPRWINSKNTNFPLDLLKAITIGVEKPINYGQGEGIFYAGLFATGQGVSGKKQVCQKSGGSPKAASQGYF